MTLPGHQTIDTADSLPRGGPEMKAAVRDEIGAPLAALRAALEGLAGGHHDEAPPFEQLESALRELLRVDRNIDALIDYAMPPELRLRRCNIEELVRSAQRALPVQIAARVEVAIEEPRGVVRTDGPLLSRCLGYLITANVSSIDRALLRAHVEEGFAVFTLSCEVHAGPRSQRIPSGPEDASLVLVFAERELGRLGGELDSKLTSSGALRITVRLPLEATGEEGE